MRMNEAPDFLENESRVHECLRRHTSTLNELVLAIGRYRQRLSSKYVHRQTFIRTSLNFTKYFAVRCNSCIEERVNEGNEDHFCRERGKKAVDGAQSERSGTFRQHIPAQRMKST